MIVELQAAEVDLVIGGQSAFESPWPGCDPVGFLDELLQQELFTGLPLGAPG